MRKVISALCMTLLLSHAYSQKTLNQKLSGTDGTSNHFTRLDASEQVSFNPQNARAIFGLDVSSDLLLLNTESDNLGMTHYRYYQTYNGIPVENSMYIVHTQQGKLTGMSGSVITAFDKNAVAKSKPSLSKVNAISAATKYVGAQKYAWEDANFEQRIKMRKGANATYYPSPQLVWYGGDDDINPKDLKLAYKIDIYSIAPRDRKFIFVDAANGKVLGFKQELMHSDTTGTAATGYSGTQTIHSDLNGSSYRLRDLTKGNGIITLHASGTHADYTSTSPNWTLTGADKWALDAHFGVAATWSFYKTTFNRNSVDNAGYALTSWVNDASNTDNADWDGSEMDYGNLSSNGNGVTGIDVTGHELTHGVTQYTCNLTYSKEPGAMNESMSDIMGKSVQFFAKPSDNSWILSNDMNWEIRSFANPNADGQPDTYQGTDWASTSTSTSSNDYGGVHTNSGVGNFMFYLLVTGGSGTNDKGSVYNVSGIGLAKADQIIYRTETVYLTSTSKYADWRTACINAATDLYGATSNELIQVENAWYAVGIGTAGGTACTTPTGLAAGTLKDTSAVISWTAVSGSTGYTLQWKLSSASTWTTVTGITTNSYTLHPLTAGTSYQVQVANVCSSTSSSSYSTAVTFSTTGTAPCTVPTGEATGSITSSSAVFSWTAVSSAVSYNIQYRIVGSSTWSTGTSTTASFSATGLTINSNYEWQVATVCSSGPTAFSASTNFTTLGLTYCTSVGGKLDGITNVTFNTINNTTSGTTAGYTDYTASQSTTVSTGSTYTLTVKINTGGNYTNYAKAWIDWNHDGTFSTSTEEYNLGTATNVTNGNSSLSPLSITVPAGAVIGTTRMRVSTQYNAAPTPCNASFDGEVEDYSVVVAAGSSCVTPSGLAVSSITNTTATASWTAVSGSTGYTLQYKLSSASTWTTVTGITTTSYNFTGLTLGTSYQVQVANVCSATSSSAYSSAVSFTTTGGTITYCASSGSTTYEYIKTVALNTINHTVANDGGYGNYTSTSTALTAGTAYTIKLTPGFASSSYKEYWTVYIDYNQDGTLNGTGETVAKGTTSSTTAVSISFTVPTTAKNGATRMRVQMGYGSQPTNPCATLSSGGDVHDYTVNISGGTGLQPGFAAIPSRSSVLKIWPNPTSGGTTNISYQLAKEGQVSARIVDLSGRNVQTIDLGNQTAGAHTYTINSLMHVINGNYMIVLYQNNEVISRNKMVILK